MNDTALQSPDIETGLLPPIAVGRYRHRDGDVRLLPYAAPELERATTACQYRIGTFHFRSGDQLLLTALFDESAQFSPFERALAAFGLVLVSADASFFDASRTESILRRFEVVALAGVNAALLDGLLALGHDPAGLFAGRVVWARPDAHARLQGNGGFELRRWIEIGPAVAMECAYGDGAHIDHLEWDVACVDGEIVLNSRLDRALDFNRYRTGIQARLVHATCRCGSADPRIIPNA
jgi:hypothetical protein